MGGMAYRVGAGICSSAGLRSAFPIASFIARRSNPAVFGTDGSRASVISPEGSGVASRDCGTEAADNVASRGGRSSSATLEVEAEDPVRRCEGKDDAVGGRDTGVAGVGFFFFKPNQLFLLLSSSPSFTTTRSPSKSGSYRGVKRPLSQEIDNLCSPLVRRSSLLRQGNRVDPKSGA